MIGEITLWGGKKIPRGWRLCDGSKLDIYQGGPLFHVIEDNYGSTATGQLHLPNLPTVRDTDGRGESRYIICVVGDFPDF